MRRIQSLVAILTQVWLVVGIAGGAGQTQGPVGSDPPLQPPGTAPAGQEVTPALPSGPAGVEEAEAAPAQNYDAVVRIPVAGLKPLTSDVEWHAGGDGGCTYASGGNPYTWWSTPLYLPQGSTLRYFRMYYNDQNTAEDCVALLTVYDLYGRMKDQWWLGSIGTGMAHVTTDELDHVVDTERYSYTIHWQPNDLGEDMQVCGFKVFYQKPLSMPYAASNYQPDSPNDPEGPTLLSSGSLGGRAFSAAPGASDVARDPGGSAPLLQPPPTSPAGQEGAPALPSGPAGVEEAEAPDQTYNASLRISGGALKPRTSNVEWHVSGGGGCTYASSGDIYTWWSTPLYLPQGSTLRYFRMYYDDYSVSVNSEAFLTVYDLYGRIVTEWSLSSSGTGQDYATRELDHVVDYDLYQYVINWRPNLLGTFMEVCGFKVDYLTPPRGTHVPYLEKSTASGSRTTGFQIQNVGTEGIDVTIFYYNTDGTLQCEETTSLDPSATISFYQGAGSPVSDCIGNDASLTEWKGSAVIESTGPIAVIANIVEGTEYASGAYMGTPDFKAGEPLILPGIFGSNTYGFTSDFAVQNASALPTTVDIDFCGSVSGPSVCGVKTLTMEIPAHASYYYDMEDDTDLPANWIGVAIVDSLTNAPLAGTVNQKPAAGAAGALLTFDGVAANKIPANPEISLPGLMKDYYDYWTGVQVIAAEDGTTGEIQIYAPGGALAHTVPFSLNQWESIASAGYLWPLSDDVVYSGKVVFATGSGTSIVSQRDSAGAVGLTYGGIYLDGTSEHLSLPFVARNYWGVSTAFAIKNSGAAGTIDIHFVGYFSLDFSITDYALGAGETVNLSQWPPGCDADPACPAQDLGFCPPEVCGNVPASYPNHWVGSVRVEGTAGMRLSAIANERGYEMGAIGDVGQAYNGFSW